MHSHYLRYIRLEYEPVFGLQNICKRFNDASHDTTNDFVEGLQYSLDEAVIMTGFMVPDHEVDHTKVRVYTPHTHPSTEYPPLNIFVSFTD